MNRTHAVAERKARPVLAAPMAGLCGLLDFVALNGLSASSLGQDEIDGFLGLAGRREDGPVVGLQDT